jgi:hypothetical protein
VEPDENTAIAGGDLYVGDMVNAEAFSDPDGGMSRRGNGKLMIQDSGDSNFLYEIDPIAKTTTPFMTEWELTLAAGSVNMDGGTAYDSSDNLYTWATVRDSEVLITGDTRKLLKITPGKAVSSFVTSAQIAAVTSGSAESVRIDGIAFERLGEPEEQIEALADSIDQLVADGALKRGQANGLKKPLANALRSLARGKTNAACSQLQDFIDKVNQKVADGALDPSEAVPLIGAAESVRSDIGC